MIPFAWTAGIICCIASNSCVCELRKTSLVTVWTATTCLVLCKRESVLIYVGVPQTQEKAMYMRWKLNLVFDFYHILWMYLLIRQHCHCWMVCIGCRVMAAISNDSLKKNVYFFKGWLCLISLQFYILFLMHCSDLLLHFFADMNQCSGPRVSVLSYNHLQLWELSAYSPWYHKL